MSEFILPVFFFAIAFFYSSVGFGGGSSYLAILSVVLTEFYEIRTVALVFNLVVVTISTVVYIKQKVVNWKNFWPFLIISIPMAFIGTQLKLSEKGFFLFLGISLLLSAIFMMLQEAMQRKSENRSFSWQKRSGLGASVGFLSGITGIGGGIFLSPLLNLLGWANPKIVASLASIFILFNSAAGLVGLVIADSFQFNKKFALPLLFAVIGGGSLGSYLSNNRFNIHLIRVLTAILVAYVGLRLILLYGFGVKV
ncbi:MAG: sulfite exporter TauE/SafE family protein [Bacteroidota bacterium]